MGKQSTRENKTIYQICREEAGLTRSEASEKMTAVSDSKIEKFEYEIHCEMMTVDFRQSLASMISKRSRHLSRFKSINPKSSNQPSCLNTHSNYLHYAHGRILEADNSHGYI